jgi:ferredoxin
VIKIDTEQCSGCGACVDVCPTGALYLVDGTAAVDRALCNSCKDCVAVCPTEAIAFASEAEPHRVPAVHAQPQSRQPKEVIRIRTQPVSFPARVLPVARAALPVAGAALAWAAREFLPQLADLVVDAMVRQARAPEATSSRVTQLAPTRAAPGRELRTRSPKAGGRARRHRQQQRRRQRGRG